MTEAGGGFGSLNPVDDSPFAGFPTSSGTPSPQVSSPEAEADERPSSNSDPQDPPAALPTL